ncbi:efflux RND transporter periplasmic adaptor subunit [Sulfurimonas sp. SAG-AH-194-L11]|nr:efflux RND transporter periplasmic adaptor subunit [Sulfurimonas sp. SAG-AH-194-L11]MDF1877099.1 efflux RND transporter periplasmic adaptor subunit [Sulfurimonas sp. SAG-AH-194-L11]
MIKKLTLIALISVHTLMAKPLFVEGKNKMVQTSKPKSTKSVYLGSFLAQGHLPAGQTFRIDAPLEGVVEKLDVGIYETISKGKLLLVIKSPKILELEATYINLLIEKEYNANEVARLKPLYEASVVAKKQYLKAQNTLAKYATQTEFYYHLLQEWGLSKIQVKSITKTKKPVPNIKIYAPISGKITDLNIFPKMYLQRGEHMMTLINEQSAHLEVALPLDIAKKLEPGFTLYIDDKPVEVESIAAEVDVRTQTVAVHLLPKDEFFIMPNEKKNIKLFWPKNAFEISVSSVIKYNNKPTVFVEKEGGYALIYIDILGRSSSKVYVDSPEITASSKIVISGAISLKGALEGQSDD